MFTLFDVAGVFAAVRHSDSVNGSAACVRLRCRAGDSNGSTARHAAAACATVSHSENALLVLQPSEAIVVNSSSDDVMNSSDERLFSAIVSVSSPLISHHQSSLCPTPNHTSLIGDITHPAESEFVISQRLSAAAAAGCISQSSPLTVSESAALHASSSLAPCDRLLTADNTSSNVSTCTATKTRTNSLLSDYSLVDTVSSQLGDDNYAKQSSVVNDLQSLAVDGFNVTLASTVALRNCDDYFLLSDQLPPEINRIHNTEAEKVSLSCSVVKNDLSMPVIECSAMSVADCVLPNVALSTDTTSPTQNGLSVGHIVSRLKSMTAMAAAKSQKTVPHLKSKLHIFSHL